MQSWDCQATLRSLEFWPRPMMQRSAMCGLLNRSLGLSTGGEERRPSSLTAAFWQSAGMLVSTPNRVLRAIAGRLIQL